MKRRYLYRTDSAGNVVRTDITATGIPGPASRLELMTGSFYDGAVTAEGIPIDSRSKFKAHMAANGLTHSSDYSQRYLQGRRDDVERERKSSLRTDLRKAWDMLSVRGKRGR